MKRLLLILSVTVCLFPLSAKDEMKTNYRNALVMAYSPANNVFEDDNLKLEIYDEQLWATNKTNRTIFIDLSQFFLIHNGTSYPATDILHKDEKNASKVKRSDMNGDFISIAPNNKNETFICNFAGLTYGKYSSVESPSSNFSEYDERLLNLISEMVGESTIGDKKKYYFVKTTHRHLTEDESISNIGVNLAYAFTKNTENWTPIEISTWVSDVYFTPYYIEIPKELDKNEKRGFGAKKTEAAKIYLKADSPFEYDKDKSPIIIADFEGDFKKGEFKLNKTRIKKPQKLSLGGAIAASLLTVVTGGIGAGVFFLLDDIYLKSVIVFDGETSNWGNMKYFNGSLNSFNNDR